MKKIFYSITTILLLTMLLSLSSCLKDSRYVDFTNVGTEVELPLSAVNPTAFTVRALPIQAAAQTFPVVINVAAPNPLKSALNVTLKINTDTITALNNQYIADSTAYYNDTTGTVPAPTAPGRYQLPPANAFSVSSLTATVPANQNTTSITISVNTQNFDVSKFYLIPITLVSASGQKVSIYNTVIFNVQAKNKFDGQYTVNGTMNDIANAAITGDYPIDYYLETQGANTDALFDYNYAGAFGHEILSSGSTSYFGSFSPLFTFDASGNITNVTNYYGQVSGPHGRSAILDPSGQNKFISGTPGTKGAVFQVSYILVQADFGGNEVFFNETYTYDGPRP